MGAPFPPPDRHLPEDPLSNRIAILVGTMTGTAEIVAEDIRDMCKAEGWEVELLLMDDLDCSVFEQDAIFLICTSTYGQGDVPDNARALYESLKNARPDLAGVRYGVFGLGDRTYAKTFNFGPKRFDDVLTELGAERIGERYMHDASAGTLPEQLALDWAQDWVGKVKERLAATA